MAGALERQLGDKASREEGTRLVQAEFWRTGALACGRARSFLLAPEHPGSQARKAALAFPQS